MALDTSLLVKMKKVIQWSWEVPGCWGQQGKDGG